MSTQAPPTWPQPTTNPPPKRKRGLGRILLYALAALGVLLGTLVVIGVSAAPDTPPNPAPARAEAQRAAQATSDPVPEPTNGPAPAANRDEPATADTPAPAAPEPEPEPAPEPPPLPAPDPNAVRDIVGNTFAANPDTRTAFITDLETNMFTLDSVDDVTYDPAAGHVTVHATSLFGGSDGYYDRNPAELDTVGWDFMRHIGQTVYGAVLPDLDWEGDLAAAVPGFTLALDAPAGGGHTVTCPANLLVRLSQRSADRDAYTAECQVQ